MIIFLYGEDKFRSLDKLAAIKEKFLEKNRENFALDVFDFSDGAKDIQEVVFKASTGGLFSAKKLTVIKNIIASKMGEDNHKLFDFLNDKKQAESKDLILVFWEGEGIEKKSKIFKLLARISKSQEFSPLTGAKFVRWVKDQVQKIGPGEISIEESAAEKLAVYVGGDMFLLSSEIQKLANFKGKGEIQAADVEHLVRAKVESDIFKTVDALARRDKREALRLLHNHLESGDDPFYLLSMYFFQFRNLLKVKTYAENNIAPQTVASELKIHPFVARKSMEQAKQFTLEKLKKLYRALCDIDYHSKTGKTDITLALDMFVAMV